MGFSYLLVIITGIISGAIVVAGQVFSTNGLSLFELAVFPYVFTLIFLGPFLFKKKYRFKKENLPLFLFYGFASALIIFGQFGAVILKVPVPVVALLLYTQPFWTIIFSRIFFKEMIHRESIIACVLVLIGVIFLTKPWEVNVNWVGLAVAFLGGVGLSLWVIAGSRSSKLGIPPVTSKYAEALFTFPFVFLAFPIIGLFVSDPAIVAFRFSWPWQMWAGLIVFNLVTQIFSHLCYLKGTQKVPTVDAGIILLLEPVSAAVIAAVFLHQPITANMVLGGTLIVLANYLVIRGSAAGQVVLK